MLKEQALGAKAYLKKLGFCLDKKPHQIDRLLLKSLSAEEQGRLRTIWAMRNAELATGLEQYLVPQTLKQASLLFSYDWPRTIASLEWIDRIVTRTNYKSIVEMGC